MNNNLTDAQLFSWGWRAPFLASAVLVLVGLYVRLQLVETPAFKRSVAQGERVRVPFLVVFSKHPRELILGTLGATTTFAIFYLMTVFALGWATGALGFDRRHFLILQMISVLFFGLTIPFSALVADRIGERVMLIIATLLIIVFGCAFQPLFSGHHTAKVLLFLALGASWRGDRLDVWSAGQRSRRLVSDGGALHRHIPGLQSGRNIGRLARAADRDPVGHALRRGLCGVLSVGGRPHHLDRIAADQG